MEPVNGADLYAKLQNREAWLIGATQVVHGEGCQCMNCQTQRLGELLKTVSVAELASAQRSAAMSKADLLLAWMKPGVVLTEVQIATLWAGITAMAEDRPATDAGTVAQRVDAICDDALAGRLSKPQRAAVRGAVDRAERITPDSDSAVGRAIGG